MGVYEREKGRVRYAASRPFVGHYTMKRPKNLPFLPDMQIFHTTPALFSLLTIPLPDAII